MSLFGPPDLEKLKEKGDVKGLIKALKYQKSEYVRYHAAELLAKMKSSLATPAIVAALEEERSSFARERIISALGTIGDTRAIEPLLKLLYDPDEKTRVAAVTALGETGDAQLVKPICALLKDKDESVRMRATQSLFSVNPEDAAQAISESVDVTRASGWITKALVGPGPWAVPLLSKFEKLDTPMRVIVIRACRGWGNPRAMKIVIKALKDKDADVHRASVYELCRYYSDENDVKVLIPALNDTESDIRRNVAEVFGHWGDKTAIEPLKARLKDSDHSVRLAAALALKELGWKSGKDEAGLSYEELIKINQLKEAIFTKSDPEKEIKSLGKIRTVDSVNALVETLIEPLEGGERIKELIVTEIAKAKENKAAAESIINYISGKLHYEYYQYEERLKNVFEDYTSLILDLFLIDYSKSEDGYVWYYDLKRNFEALEKLRGMKNPMSNALLHLVAQMEDPQDMPFEASEWGMRKRGAVDLKKLRDAAAEELKKRGSPVYDASPFLVESNWVINNVKNQKV